MTVERFDPERGGMFSPDSGPDPDGRYYYGPGTQVGREAPGPRYFAPVSKVGREDKGRALPLLEYLTGTPGPKLERFRDELLHADQRGYTQEERQALARLTLRELNGGHPIRDRDDDGRIRFGQPIPEKALPQRVTEYLTSGTAPGPLTAWRETPRGGQLSEVAQWGAFQEWQEAQARSQLQADLETERRGNVGDPALAAALSNQPAPEGPQEAPGIEDLPPDQQDEWLARYEREEVFPNDHLAVLQSFEQLMTPEALALARYAADGGTVSPEALNKHRPGQKALIQQATNFLRGERRVGVWQEIGERAAVGFSDFSQAVGEGVRMTVHQARRMKNEPGYLKAFLKDFVPGDRLDAVVEAAIAGPEPPEGYRSDPTEGALLEERRDRLMLTPTGKVRPVYQERGRIGRTAVMAADSAAFTAFAVAAPWLAAFSIANDRYAELREAGADEGAAARAAMLDGTAEAFLERFIARLGFAEGRTVIETWRAGAGETIGRRMAQTLKQAGAGGTRAAGLNVGEENLQNFMQNLGPLRTGVDGATFDQAVAETLEQFADTTSVALLYSALFGGVGMATEATVARPVPGGMAAKYEAKRRLMERLDREMEEIGGEEFEATVDAYEAALTDEGRAQVLEAAGLTSTQYAERAAQLEELQAERATLEQTIEGDLKNATLDLLDARRTEPPSVDEIQGFVDRAAQVFVNAAPVRIVETPEQLPEGAQRPDARAAVVGDTVYLVRSQLRDSRDVAAQWAHEQLAHIGLDLRGPEGRQQFLDDLTARLRERGLSVQQLRGLAPEYAALPDSEYLEELLGRTAEQIFDGESLTVEQVTLWQAFLDWLKETLGLADVQGADEVLIEAVMGLARDMRGDGLDVEAEAVAAAEAIADAAIAEETAPTLPEDPQDTDVSGTDPQAGLEPQAFMPVQVPVSEIKVDARRFQFKEADEEGIQKALEGEWDPFKAGLVLLWQAENGDLFVANGHHRVAYAKAKGVETLSAQVLREADGYSDMDARRIAAEVNIAEGKGTIYDHARYFRNEGEYDAAALEQRGLRTAAREGYALGRLASDNVYSEFIGRRISKDRALAIVKGAGEDTVAQDVALQTAQEGKGRKLDNTELQMYARELAMMRQAGQVQQRDRDPNEPEDFFGEMGFEETLDLREAAQAAGREKAKRVKELKEQKQAFAHTIKSDKRIELAAEAGVTVTERDKAVQTLLEIDRELVRLEGRPRWSARQMEDADFREYMRKVKEKARAREANVRRQLDPVTGGAVRLIGGDVLLATPNVGEDATAYPWRITRFAEIRGEMVPIGHTLHRQFDGETGIPVNRSLVHSAAHDYGPVIENPGRIKFSVEAYHGGAAEFDRFSTEFMGTGEGAQAYGWGLYFTSVEGIARDYAKKIASYRDAERDPIIDSELLAEVPDLVQHDVEMIMRGRSVQLALEDIGQQIRDMALKVEFHNESARTATDKGLAHNHELLAANLDEVLGELRDGAEWIEENKDRIRPKREQTPRQLYKVTLHQGKKPGEYEWLKWNEDVSPAMLERIFQQAAKEDLTGVMWDAGKALKDDAPPVSGHGLYWMIANHYGGSKKQASLFLLRAGIDGVKYPANSMGRGDGSKGWNYVVFDDSAVTIKERTQFSVAPGASEADGIEPIRDEQGRLLAPNGKPSNLNERQWRQVRTAAFKAWFGDWENDPDNASKVVDENGEPRVVYHGTIHGRLESFTKKDLHGWYFTDSYMIAKTYTLGPKHKGKNPAVLPVFLNIRNPLVYEDPRHPNWKGLRSIRELYASAPAWQKSYNSLEDLEKEIRTTISASFSAGREYLSTDFEVNVYNALYSAKNISLSNFKEVRHAFAKEIARHLYSGASMAGKVIVYDHETNTFRLESGAKGHRAPTSEEWWQWVKYSGVSDTRDWEAVAYRLGNDGVIFDGIRDSAVELFGYETASRIFVVFDPTDIKSAVANVGTFEPTDPRIRHSLGPEPFGPSRRTRRAVLTELSRRVLEGEQVSAEDARALLPEATPKQAETLAQAAQDVARAVQQSLDAAGNDIMRARELAPEILRRVYGEGKLRGALEEEAREIIRQRQQRQREAERAGIQGLTPERIRAESLTGPAVELDSPEAREAFLKRLKEATRQEAIRRGYFTERRATWEQSPEWRALYRKTLRDVLHRLSRELVGGLAREQITIALRELPRQSVLATTDRRALSLLERISRHKVRQDSKAILGSIDELLEKYGRDKSATKEFEKRGIDPKIGQEFIARVKAAMDLTEEQVAQKQEEIRTLLEGNAKEIEKEGAEGRPDVLEYTDDLIMQNMVLEYYGALDSRPLSDQADALKHLQGMIDAGIASVLKRREERDRRITAKRDVLIAAIEAAGGRVPQRIRESTWGAAATSVFTIEDFMNDLIRFAPDDSTVRKAAQELVNEIVMQMNDATYRADLREKALTREFEKAVRRIYGVRFAGSVIQQLEKKRTEFRRFSRTKRDSLSKANLLFILAAMEQQRYRDAAMREGSRLAFRLDQVEDIREQLSPEDLALLDWMRDFFVRERPALSAVQERVTGVAVKEEDPLYFPVKVNVEGGLDERHSVLIIVPKSMTPRVSHNRDIDENTSALKLFASRMQEAEHYKAFAELSIEMRGIFAHSDFHQITREEFGKSYKSRFIEFVTDVLSQNQIRDLGFDNPLENALYEYSAITSLGLNVRTALAQPTGVALFAHKLGFLGLGKAMAASFSPEGMAFTRKVVESPEFKARYGFGQSEAMAHMVRKNDGTALRRWLRNTILIQGFGESLQVLLFGGGLMRAFLNDPKAKAMPRAEAEQYAIGRLFQMLDGYQQSRFVKDANRFIRRGGSGVKFLMQFTGPAAIAFAKQLRAYRDAFARPGLKTLGAAARATIVNHALAAAGFYGAKMIADLLLFGEEPDEFDQTMLFAQLIQGMAGGFGPTGFIGTAFADMIAGLPFAGGEIPAARIVTDFDKLSRVLDQTMWTDSEEFWTGMVEIAAIFALPVKDAQKLYENRIED